MLCIKFFTFNPIQENTYVVYNTTGDAILIDPGCYGIEEEQTLLNFIVEKNLNVKHLLNTHCHLDHVFGNKSMAKHFGLELQIHANEAQVLARASESGKGFGLPFDNYNGPVYFLQEGDVITLGTDALEVLFTPGHSPGSICFYSKNDNFVIGGDVLFKGSIGRTDLPGGNHQALVNSIRNQLFVLPDQVKVYPGHGSETTIGYEKLHNPFFQH